MITHHHTDIGGTNPMHRSPALQRSLRLLRRSIRAHWSTMRHEQSGDSSEKGAVLILAMVFLVAVSVIVGGLTEWTSNDLMNSAVFKQTQTVNSDATNAVNLAIQSIRYTPLLYTSANNTLTDQTLNASPPSYCWGSGPSQDFNMNVYCTTVWNPTMANTRQVTVTACPQTQTLPTTGTASWTAAQSSCPQSPFLQAIVTFDDYPSGVSAPNNDQCVVYCGSTLTINSWNFHPTVPTVTNVVGLAGTFDGKSPLTIYGSGFTAGAKVNFVVTDPLAQVKNSTTQQIVPATNVTVNVAAQTITAWSPAVTTLANYYITVTTPGGGTSLVLPSATFVYTSIAPVVTGLSPTSGYTTHGTAITITGSGFINGATVTMVQENNGSVVTPLNTQQATAVQVVSNSTITAITYPFTTQGQSFYVVVTTSSGGASPYTNNAVFTLTQAPA